MTTKNGFEKPFDRHLTDIRNLELLKAAKSDEKNSFSEEKLLFGGSRRRIRTLTNRVRVCRATFTQFGCILFLSLRLVYYTMAIRECQVLFLKILFFQKRKGQLLRVDLEPRLMVYLGKDSVALVISYRRLRSQRIASAETIRTLSK